MSCTVLLIIATLSSFDRQIWLETQCYQDKATCESVLQIRTSEAILNRFKGDCKEIPNEPARTAERLSKPDG